MVQENSKVQLKVLQWAINQWKQILLHYLKGSGSAH